MENARHLYPKKGRSRNRFIGNTLKQQLKEILLIRLLVKITIVLYNDFYEEMSL